MAESMRKARAHCNQCLRSTNHFILAVRDVHDEDPEHGFWSDTRYEMLECCGCERITLRETYRWVGEPEPNVTYFPPAVTRRMPAWMTETEFAVEQRELCDLLREIYTAMHSRSNRIALMGLRAVIDMVVAQKFGDRGTFGRALDAMEGAGYIGRVNRQFLEAAVDAGSAASHRGFRPDDRDLNRIMDIVENLVQTVCVLGAAAEAIRKGTPPRKVE